MAHIVSERSNIVGCRWRVGAALGLALLLGSALERQALALEPLSAHLRSAKASSFDAREQRATLAQRASESTASTYRLLPVLGVQGTYTRNQYEAIVGNKVIVPENQVDLYLTANLTLIDVGQWEKMGAANRTHEAAESRLKSTALDVERLVTRDYYQVVAAEAVKSAALRTLEAAEKNLAYVETRKSAGFAQELDAKRAEAEVAKDRQLVADASYQVAVARRSLGTDSGLTPSEGAPTLGGDAAQLEGREGTLAESEGKNLEAHPQVRAAADETRAAERTATATRATWLPTLSVAAQERLTNATGFQDRSSIYALSATVAVKFDVSQLATANAQAESAVVAKVREERTRAQARDRVFVAWQAVHAALDKARSARAGLEASKLAVSIAKQRYEAGTATFLDVVTSERDAFQAEVTRIQVDADLAFARADLRIAGGSSVDESRAP
jgi:outer membrane protein TolC